MFGITVSNLNYSLNMPEVAGSYGCLHTGSPICQVTATSSSDVAEFSLLSELPSLGQSDLNSSTEPGFLTTVDNSGQCVPWHSLHLVSANQDYCHRCLLNGLGSPRVVAESSRTVVRTGSFCGIYSACWTFQDHSRTQQVSV